MEKRISLRPLSRNDLDHFYVWASDPEVAKHMTWNAYTSKHEAEHFLKNVAEKDPWFKAICVDGVPVGSITLAQGTGPGACRVWIGYVIAKGFWGKGIATEAIKQAIKEGFTIPDLRRIEAFVDPDNIGSKKALEKAGMTCDGLLKNYTLFKGELKDRYIYSITR